MKLIDVAGYIGESRQNERVVAIAREVTKEDWCQLPRLCKVFHDHFGVCLSVMPIQMGEETWLVGSESVDLDRAALFVAGFVSGMHGDGR